MPVAPTYRSGYYEGARRDVNQRFGTDAAMNAYGRFLGQQRGQRSLGDMSRNFERQVPGFSASFSRRGLAGPGVESGVMGGAMQRFVGDYQRDFGRAQQDLADGLRGFDIQGAQIEQHRNQALSDLELQQANDIALTAMNIEALRPYLGGF